jgi:hypothetical protein
MKTESFELSANDLESVIGTILLALPVYEGFNDYKADTALFGISDYYEIVTALSYRNGQFEEIEIGFKMCGLTILLDPDQESGEFTLLRIMLW